MSFIGEADGPDPHDAARAKAELDGDKPPRLQHRDKVRRKVKMGEVVPYNWIILRIDTVTRDGKWVWCDVQIDLKGTRSLK